MKVLHDCVYNDQAYPRGTPNIAHGSTCSALKGYWNTKSLNTFAGTQQQFMDQRFERVRTYSESIGSCGSDENDEQNVPMFVPHEWDNGAEYSTRPFEYFDSFDVSSGLQCDMLSETVMNKDVLELINGCSLPSFWRSSHEVAADYESARHTYSEFNTAVGASQMRLRHRERQQHLLKSKNEPGTTIQKKSKSNTGDGVTKKKKRYRPFAAVRERERLVVMNEALKKLKTCLPLGEKEQKMTKKQILLSAAFYIRHLSETLSHERDFSPDESQKSINLNKHEYLLVKSEQL